jgi:hypothetical protein
MTANTLQEFINEAKSQFPNATVHNLNDLRLIAGPEITIHYESVAEVLHRIVLGPTTKYIHTPLAAECNGVVIDARTWEVLALPARTVVPYHGQLDKILPSYDIYYAHDGSVLTLYWYEGAWVLSSTHGYDVSRYSRLGNTKYMQAVLELAKLYPEFSLDALDHSKSYTIGVHHKEFQPLDIDEPRLWHICTGGLRTYERST